MKICLLGYRSNPHSGGQGIYLRHLSLALTEAGHEVEVISGPPYPELDERVSLIKLPSLDLYADTPNARAFQLRYLSNWTDFFEYCSTLTGGFPEPYTFGRRLVDHFRKHPSDYDVIHDNQSLCYGVLQLQNMGYPVITTIHHPITRDLALALADETHWGLRLLIRRWHSFLGMQKRVVRQLKHLTTVSYAARSDIADAFQIDSDRISVIHNGIDTKVFHPMPSVLREPLRLMTTASADTPLKGVSVLLHALKIVVRQFPTVKLCLLSRLEAGGPTERLINSLNLGQHIELQSNVSDAEMVELYARASIAVVPSLYEGFGFPAGEAMACGVPVISTRGGALPEVVGDCGVLVKPGCSQALADAIINLLTDSAKRDHLAKAGQARISQDFQWHVAAQRFAKLYQTVSTTSHVS
jgi:glycosyltransferase involved in cell wall biosynthesis